MMGINHYSVGSSKFIKPLRELDCLLELVGVKKDWK
jgi:hypothetical protein